jgi:tetratricopeptide (TPR) repeat protein
VNYRLKRINTDEFLEALQEAISLTIPMYGNISLSSWPLSFYELILFLNISTAYAEKNDYSKAIEILEQANNAIKQSYMDEYQRVIMQVGISYNLAKWLGEIGEYERSIDNANEGIQLCRKHKLGNVLPQLLFYLSWSKEQLIEAGVISPTNRKECLAIYRQAYYLASAMQNTFIANSIEEHTLTEYNVSFDTNDFK